MMKIDKNQTEEFRNNFTNKLTDFLGDYAISIKDSDISVEEKLVHMDMILSIKKFVENYDRATKALNKDLIENDVER